MRKIRQLTNNARFLRGPHAASACSLSFSIHVEAITPPFNPHLRAQCKRNDRQTDNNTFHIKIKCFNHIHFRFRLKNPADLISPFEISLDSVSVLSGLI